MSIISDNLCRISKETGLKDKIIAERSGINPKVFSAMKNGRREVHHTEMINLCATLSCTPNDLYGIGEQSKKTA